MNKTISIYQAGAGQNGSGQAVLAVNLAIALARQTKESVALLDLSLSGSNEIELLLNFKPSKSIADLVPLLGKLDENLIRGYLSQHSSGVYVLGGAGVGGNASATPGLNRVLESTPGLNRVLESTPGLNRVLNNGHLLQIISKAYPYVIATTQNSYDNSLVAAFDESDLIILALAPNLLFMNSAKSFLEVMKSWHFGLNMIKPVVCTPDDKYGFDNKRVSEYLGIEVLCSIPFEAGTVIPSINEGKPCVIASPHSRFSGEIKKLANVLSEDKVFEGITKRDKKEPVFKETAMPTRHSPAMTGESTTDYPVKPGNDINVNKYIALKEKIHMELIAKLNLVNINTNSAEARDNVRKTIQDLIATEAETGAMERSERARFIDELLDEVLGLGCLETYLKDKQVTEIMVNGPNDIYIEKAGKIHYTGARFTSETQLRAIIDRIVSPMGRRVDESSPLVDARLIDGSRVNIIIPPLSLVGPSITIRKFSDKKLTTDDLVEFGAMTGEMADFLKICVSLRKNIVISGGTGSGKTTLLNVASGFIPEDERIVTIEDSAELRLPQKHVVRLESKPASIEGKGEITIRALVINALRMRPDRIVVGECRSKETLDMLQAMNTGHDGSLTTVHANTPRDAIKRLETMVLFTGIDFPVKAIREQIASAINVIVQTSRMQDGSRKIVEIAEITGMEGDVITLAPIFKFNQKGIDENTGRVIGRFSPTGNVPTFIQEIKSKGLKADMAIFS